MKTMFRKFLTAPLMALMVAFTIPATMPLTGCTTSTAQLKADGAAIAQAVESIAQLEAQQGNTVLANELTTASTSLQSAVNAYTGPSASSIISTAAAALEIALAAVPVTAAYAPLVPIAVGAIEVLLANIGVSAPAPAAAPLNAHATRLDQLRAYRAPHRFLRSQEGDFRAAWNGAVNSYGLPSTLAVK